MSRRRLPRRPTPSMALAFVALVAAFSGTAYGVDTLRPHSVASKHIKPGAVTRSAIRAGAVDSSRIKDDSVTGRDIAEATLGSVPSAQNAAHATSADSAAAATAAAGLDKVVYRTATVTVPQAPAEGETASAGATARCDAGLLVVGGGARLDDGLAPIDSFPDAGGSAWTAHAANGDATTTHDLTAYAICVRAADTG